ncbi:hypothetical protein LMIY3S_01855 [Labrys miyagiensis]
MNRDKTSGGLLLQCIAAAGQGTDFPTIWDTILRRHPLVIGVPMQIYREGRPLLEVRLVTNQSLIYDSHQHGYTIV